MAQQMWFVVNWLGESRGTQNNKGGGSGHGCLGCGEARRRVFICKADTVWDKYCKVESTSTCELRKVPSDESDKIGPEATSPTSKNAWTMKIGEA